MGGWLESLALLFVLQKIHGIGSGLILREHESISLTFRRIGEHLSDKGSCRYEAGAATERLGVKASGGKVEGFMST